MFPYFYLFLLQVPQEDEFKIESLLPKQDDKIPSKMIRPTPGIYLYIKINKTNL